MKPEDSPSWSAVPQQTPSTPEPARAAKRPLAFWRDRRFVTLVLLTFVLLGAHLSFGILDSYRGILLAIAASFLTEIIVARVFTEKRPAWASGYMTGISVGILIRSLALWPFALCSMISVTSKYVIRVKGRHIWNPSNFGICAMLFLAPYSVAPLSVQWGNNLWPMLVVWMLGIFTLWRLKLLHIAGAYVVSFFAFAALRSLITGAPVLAEIAPITGPMYQLFVFFMLTDPRTTVSSRRGRIAVSMTIAAVEAVMRLGQIIYAPFYALFVVGPSAMLIELWREKRGEPARTTT